MWRDLIARALLLAYMLLILYLALGPAPTGAQLPHLDKLMHAGSWGLMALLCLCVWQDGYLKAFLVCGVHGAATEIMQGTRVVGRTADWFDWFADLTGALIAVGAVAWARRRVRATA